MPTWREMFESPSTNLHQTSSPQNPFRLRKAVGSIFSPRGTRVLRVLLQGPFRSWKVRDLARSAQVSVGWVSSVRKHLLEQEWAAEDPTGFKVTRPHAILDSWVKQPNTWPKNAEIRDYSVLLNDPEELAAKLKEALPGQEAVFTQWFAAWLRHPYTETPIVTAYVKSFPEDALIKEKLLGRRVSDGRDDCDCPPKDQGALNRPKQSVASNWFRTFRLPRSFGSWPSRRRTSRRTEEME